MIEALADWFVARGWSPFAFQHEVWSAYLAGESGLVHSATGSGKTLAAWLGPLAEGMQEQGQSPSPRPSPKGEGGRAPPLRVLWITPMRALAGDTVFSMQKAVEGLGLPW